MLHLELNAADLNGIVSAASVLPCGASLAKLNHFRITDEGVLKFDQQFFTDSTVSLGLSCDDGNVLIDILRLADNKVGNFFLGLGSGIATGKIEAATGGMLQKVSSDRLMFDPRQLPLKPKIRSLAVREGKIVLDATI